MASTRIAAIAAALGAGLVAGPSSTALAQPGTEPADTSATAPALPGPNEFVSGLDLECYDTPGPALNQQVPLRHLNPVLLQLGLPAHVVTVGALVQTCVPVQKNGVSPSAAALPFIEQTDLACYKIDTPPVANPPTLTLKHLNPVLVNLPAHTFSLRQALQLCVPVAKNGVIPTPDVLRLVQFIDLECYDAPITAHPTFTVSLKQFNPQLGNIPVHPMTLVSQPRQLCVPVQKGSQAIPDDVLGVIRWIDLEKFAASPVVSVPPVNVVLSHLNPLFTTLPRVPVTLARAIALMVPVSKNGAVPPPP
ncbi:MAG TPA: hypothetical protein VGD37_10495 [Kofleriaceae bacterium]